MSLGPFPYGWRCLGNTRFDEHGEPIDYDECQRFLSLKQKYGSGIFVTLPTATETRSAEYLSNLGYLSVWVHEFVDWVKPKKE